MQLLILITLFAEAWSIAFNASGIVIDMQNYKLAGVELQLNINNQMVATSMTFSNGTFIMLGSIAAPSAYQASITAFVGCRKYTQSYILTATSTTPYLSYSDLRLNISISDIRADSLITLTILTVQNCFQSQVSTVNQLTNKPLPSANINFTITSILNDGTFVSQLVMAQTDQTGSERFHFMIPQCQSLVGIYVAGCNRFWNTLSIDLDNPPISMVNVNEGASLSISLTPGHINQQFTATLIDAKSNTPIVGTVSVMYNNSDYTMLVPQTYQSTSAGKLNFNVLLECYQYQMFTLQITAVKYLPKVAIYSFNYNLNNSQNNSVTTELGSILIDEEPVSVGVVNLSGQITDFDKVINIISGATVLVNAIPSLGMELTGITTQDGKYSFSFSIPLNKDYTLSITASAQDFQTETSPISKITVQLTQNIVINLPLLRVRQMLELDDQILSSGAPLQKANVTLVSSSPAVINSTLLQTTSTHDDGSFSIAFQCYQSITFLVNFNISVENYVPVLKSSSPFNCTGAKQQLAPIQVQLSQIQITVTVTGKFVKFDNSPEVNLPIAFSTQPATIAIQNKTFSDGSFLFINSQLAPQLKYSLIISYTNGLQKLLTITQDYTTTKEISESYSFNTLYYQSLVDASITGIITVAGKPFSGASVSASCGSLGQIFTSTNISAQSYTLSIKPLVEEDQIVHCDVTVSGASIEPISGKVDLKEPDFKATLDLATDYKTTTITLEGIALDPQKKPKIGLAVTFLTTPDSITSNKTTNQTGFWSVADDKIIPVFNYTGYILYLDGNGTHRNISQVLTNSAIIGFPTINYADFVQSTIAGIVKVGNQPYQSMTIAIQCQNQSANTMSDKNGAFSIGFKLFAECDLLINCQLTASSIQVFAVSISVSLASPTFSNDSVIVSTDYKTNSVTISGSVVGPDANPKSGLLIIFSTLPDTIQTNTTTNPSGLWTLADNKFIPGVAYALLVQYSDPLGNHLNMSTPAQDISTASVEFPKIDYRDFANVSLSGVVQVQKLPFQNATVTASCSSFGSIYSGTTTTSQTGSFTLIIKLLAQLGLPISCNVKASNPEIIDSQQTVPITPPVFQSSLVMQTDYQYLTLSYSGQVVDPYGKPKSGLSIQFWTIPDSQNSTSLTNSAGTYQFSDNKEINSVNYSEFVCYNDGMGQLQKVTNNKEGFPLIDYQDNVNASVNGVVMVAGSPYMNVKVVTNCSTAQEVTNNQGMFAMSFKLFAQWGSVYYCSVSGTNELMVDVQNIVQLKGPTYSQSITMISDFRQNAVSILIFGSVIDPYSRPKASFSLQFTTLPDTLNQVVQTNGSGVWSLLDTKFIEMKSYQILVSYKDPKGSPVLSNLTMLTQTQSSIEFPTIDEIENVTASVKGTVKVQNSGIAGAKVSCTCISLTLTVEADSLTDNNGNYQISISPMASKDTLVGCNVSVSDVQLLPTWQSVVLKTPTFSAEADLSTSYHYITTQASGVIVDPYGQPKAGVSVTFSTQPPTTPGIYNVQTDKTGSWNVTLNVIQGVNYTGSAVLQDGTGATVNETGPLNGTEFNKVYLKDFVAASVSGSINLQIAAQQIVLVCSSVDRNKKNISLQNVTDGSGAFSFMFEMVAAFNLPVSCNVSLAGTTKLKPASQTAMLSAPSYSAKVELQTSYNAIYLSLQGYVIDPLGHSIPNALISVQLTPPDPLVSSITMRTSPQGQYLIQIPAVDGFNYAAIYSVSCPPDFILLQSQAVTLQKPTTTENFTLQRTQINITVSSIIVDQKSQPVHSVTVTIALQNPVMLTPAQLQADSTSTNDNGQFTLQFRCFLDTIQQLQFELESSLYMPTETSLQSFNCSQQSITLPPMQIDLSNSKKAASVTVTGLVIDDVNQPKPNILLTLTTLPVTVPYTGMTNTAGTFQIIDQALVRDSTYTLEISYTNSLQKQVNSQMQYTVSKQDTQIAQFPTIYYQQLENVAIEGALQCDTTSPMQIQVYLNCNNGVNSSVYGNANKTYNIFIKVLLQFNQVIECDLTVPQSSRYGNFDASVEIKAPNLIIHQDIYLSQSDEMKEKMSKYYENIMIIGQIISEYDCPGYPEKPVSGVDVYVLNRQNQEVPNTESISDDDGMFKISFYILKTQGFSIIIFKSQVQQTFALGIHKQDYISYNVYFVPSLVQRLQTTGSQLIDLGMISITHIGGLLKCPDDSDEDTDENGSRLEIYQIYSRYKDSL